jgi:cysteine desulfurase / selenocysteine lyase
MNLDQLRNNTPGCKHVLHLNNAGASLVSQTTLQAQLDYLNEEALHGGYETAQKYYHEIESFYSEVAQLLNASIGEIAFTDSATTAWERAFFSINFQKGDEIISDSTAYASNYIAYLQAEKRFGTKTIVVPANVDGDINMDEFKNLITHKTKLISITHIPTSNGVVNPAEEIGSIASAQNIYYLLDACQSAGQYPLDVKKIKCDFLTATGRKYLRGPRGTGLLYANTKNINDFVPFNLDLHSAEWTSRSTFKSRNDARKFETWESNVAAKIGLTSAVSQLNALDINQVWNRIIELATYMRKQLTTIQKVKVLDTGKVKCGIVTLTAANITPEKLKEALQLININTSVAIKSGTLIDMENRHLDAVLRASVHYYNTKEEIDIFVNSLKQIVDKA